MTKTKLAIIINAAFNCKSLEESLADMGQGYGEVYKIVGQPREKLERDYKLAIRIRPDLEQH